MSVQAIKHEEDQNSESHHKTAQRFSSTASNSPVSGAGMDKRVAKKKHPLMWSLLVGAAVIIGLLIVYSLLSAPAGKALAVDSQRIRISTVTRAVFEDFIPVRGRVTPAKTLYLDAVEGGRVERILVEDGASLSEGDLIVELSNTSLQLSVLTNETQVAEQLNSMRSIELSLEQNRLQHKRNIADIRYQIKMLSRQLHAEKTLLGSNSISQTKFEDTRDTLDWYKATLALTLESQASDAQMQGTQLDFLKETSKRLESNLAITRKNLENMNVRAPVPGKLSGFNIEVGQSIGKGERLGQIDTPNDYKVSAFIDEFYLGRVQLGQAAQFKDYQLQISKIYPQVKNGQFEVDVSFVGQQPTNIRRGQTIQLKLTLGDASSALLVPNGAFYQDTGGKWIFVVNNDSSEAIKRNVRLGRRNSSYIEVLDGLEEGERVVTGPYTDYRDLQRLKLKSNE